MSNKLPNKPSQLLEVALSDLAKVERSKKYRVKMNAYHEPCGKICQVCLAGAVMAKTLDVDKSLFKRPWSFNTATSKKLHALDALRLGDIGGAFTELGIKTPKGLRENVFVTEYQTSPRDFKKDLRKIIKSLKEFKL